MTYDVDGTIVTSNENITYEQAKAYVERANETNSSNTIEAINLDFDGEMVDVTTTLVVREDFQRIRRITGYLVGTLDRFNDAKRAEERDRAKHGV